MAGSFFLFLFFKKTDSIFYKKKEKQIRLLFNLNFTYGDYFTGSLVQTLKDRL